MAAKLRQFLLFVLGYFSAPPEPKVRKVRRVLDVAEYGEFYFKSQILDQLGRYFVILKRMRRGDSDAYNLHARLGAHIVPELKGNCYEKYKLDPWWLENRPSFGMVMYGTGLREKLIDEGQKFWVPFAVYFRKYAPRGIPPTVQPAHNGDVYGVTVYWDTLVDRKVKKGTPTEFAVSVTRDGGVTLLKILQDYGKNVRSKRGKDKGSLYWVPRRAWGIDKFFKNWAGEHQKDVEEFLTQIFIEAANVQMAAANSFIQVRVRKKSLAALFSVNIVRTPYFFQDREAVIDPRGHKKRIFHIVRTHIRASGSAVRTHFRGLRNFSWGGYEISISVPGWHHLATAELDVGAYDEETLGSGAHLDSAGFGKTVLGWEESGLGARHD